MSEISNAKNEMLEPDAYKLRTNNEIRKETIAKVYELYQKRLKENNAIDFDDIINYTIKILTENEDIREYYCNKFKYVLVDEYQDTNKAQFTLVTILASVYKNITVVGDNDQGIYSFRGADISNILNFEKDFPGYIDNIIKENSKCLYILEHKEEYLKLGKLLSDAFDGKFQLENLEESKFDERKEEEKICESLELLNEEYKNLREKFNDIMNKYPNLQFILEDRELILNETECKMLQKLVKIYMEICDFEEKKIFLLGGKEMYFYLKDTGVIKEK